MTQPEKVRICIVYPADPLGVAPGGIDSFIRGILRWAPKDLKMSVLGVTTDPESRPLGKWTSCPIGDQSFEFFPIIKFENSDRQGKMPLTVRYLAALFGSRRHISADVLEFHRIEPCFALLGDKRPKTVVLHQNMNVILSRDCDIRWRHCPKLYFAIEKFILSRVQSVFCVREDAVADYRTRFPDYADRFRFTPTWVDTEKFQPPSVAERQSARAEMFSEFGFPDKSRVLIWVGRLDKQKNPLLLIDTFQRLHQSHPDTRLLIVGDGVLRAPVEKQISLHGLDQQVVLCGVKPAEIIARYLKASDAFVLPSVYEGMPISVLEALGSGLPVVATDVGEISRVVRSGVNGELVAHHEPDRFAEAIAKCLGNAERYRGPASYNATIDYTPEKVLLPFYKNYRRLAANAAR